MAAGIDEIINQLIEAVSTRFMRKSTRKVGADEPLISSGIIDSFSLVDLAVYVEDTFGVRLDDTELNAGVFDSARQLAELIASRQA